jgi:E3 ubiquitin-protein ligase MARCH6
MSSLFLILKCVVVFILSWFIITIAACFAFSFPLMVGRGVFILLRVPGRYMHDPFAFAIGMCLWNPTFALLSGLFKSEHSMLRRFLGWASAFRLPPFRKLIVVSTALLMWLVLSPLFLGTLYDLVLLKGQQYFSGEQPLLDASSVAMNWATGTLLLNAWALLCYHNVFTWSFWVTVGNAALEAEFERVDNRRAQGLEQNQRGAGNGEDRPNIVRRREDHSNIQPWQGADGKIGQFVGMLTFALLTCEWDVVDHEVLLQACAFPVTRQILIALVTPSVVFAVWLLSLRLVQQETANIICKLPEHTPCEAPFIDHYSLVLYCRLFCFQCPSLAKWKTLCIEHLSFECSRLLHYWRNLQLPIKQRYDVGSRPPTKPHVTADIWRARSC